MAGSSLSPRCAETCCRSFRPARIPGGHTSRRRRRGKREAADMALVKKKASSHAKVRRSDQLWSTTPFRPPKVRSLSEKSSHLRASKAPKQNPRNKKGKSTVLQSSLALALPKSMRSVTWCGQRLGRILGGHAWCHQTHSRMFIHVLIQEVVRSTMCSSLEVSLRGPGSTRKELWCTRVRASSMSCKQKRCERVPTPQRNKSC